jgi:DNA-binding NarL/FixJ family response regulator
MIRILIADDHAIVRKGLKEILADTPDISVKGEASNGREALAKISEQAYDVVVLDIAMPGSSGLETLQQIKAEKPELPVLILSMYAEEQYAVRALKVGASGYLTKKTAPEELISAIRKVHQGGKYVTLALAERLASLLDADSGKLAHENLSDREYEVMIRIAQGKRLKEIAGDLFISEKTVSTYRTRILEKMQVDSNAELTRYAVDHHLID